MVVKLGAEESLSESAVSGRDFLLNKTRRIETKPIVVGDETIEFKIRALSGKEMQKLIEAHPPRKNDGADGRMGFNRDSFTPALLAETVLEPKLDEAEWADVWTNDNFSAGEQGDIFDLAWSVSNRGFDVPFGARG